MSGHLLGTQQFGRSEYSFNASFQDHYAKQWIMTLEWMQRELSLKARTRDELRGSSVLWLEQLRAQLRDASGADLFVAGVKQVMFQTGHDSQFVLNYQIEMNNGLHYGGILRLPEDASFRGFIVSAGSGGAALVQGYLQAGICVIEPFWAAETYSYRNDEVRKWFAYPDIELLHHFAFICGGSNAGMEAMEMYATVQAIAEAMGCNGENRLPVVLELCERQLLSGAVAAALNPAWATVLVLSGDTERLNHQENDIVVNTIWGFHRYFDLLTLLQLAEESDIIFVEQEETPSANAARACVWFGTVEIGEGEALHKQRHVYRRRSNAFIDCINQLLHGSTWRKHHLCVSANCFLETQLYRDAIDSKLMFLEQLHLAAQTRKTERYDFPNISIDGYKRRISESIEKVMGVRLEPSLNLKNVRTNKVRAAVDAPYEIYEVLIESLPGIDVAGYLLIPVEKHPVCAGPFPAVICQHGLMGRPESLAGLKDEWIYYRLAQTLAEKGFVAFVPFMNWGWGGNPARDSLAKHAFSLGMTPNRFEQVQLAAIIDFLQSRSEVIEDRIGFYGLSYGGHASLWLSECEPRLAAVITSGHFNDWHPKLTSTQISPPHSAPTSYATVEESLDMFNFDIMNQLGHAELATYHAPRPFMVENGLKDPVTPLHWVEAEFSKVRKVYDKLNAQDSVKLGHFNGPHRIWGEESLIFLEQHLKM